MILEKSIIFRMYSLFIELLSRILIKIWMNTWKKSKRSGVSTEEK